MNTSNFSLDIIRQFPETVIRTIDHGVVFTCPVCSIEIGKDSVAVRGLTVRRGYRSDGFQISYSHLPHCPHCLHCEISPSFLTKLHNSGEYGWTFNPISYNRSRKFEHVTKEKRGWFGNTKIINSVIETIPVGAEDA